MSQLFETGIINGMELKNCFVRSATWEAMADDDGAVTPKLIETMTALTKGGVGLIISSHAFVSPEGRAGPWQLGVYKDELIDGLKEMTTAVHNDGGKIVMQLAHAGSFASEQLTGLVPLSVSDYTGIVETPRREITTGDIEELVAAFTQAAARAKAAGFDGVQIHSAHGYLLSQFLSPKFNWRTDDYGGDISNRARIHLEVYQAIRKAVGDDYPVLIKINCSDFDPKGLTPEDSVQAGRMLAEAGLDAVELSGGLLTGGQLSPSRMVKTEEQEAYFKNEAKIFKKEIGRPLILVGGMRSFNVAERLIEDGVADYISLSRPFIREPGLVNRWKSGDRSKAKCKSDNLCFQPAMEGKGIYCLTEEREKTT